jgi:sulfonate transport system substrate-binding protein
MPGNTPAGVLPTGPGAPGTNASAIVVPANSPIHSVTQLKGKKIAVAQGSSADYHLLTVLNKAHLSVHDVSLDYLQPADGLAALTSGHVDAWDIWSPYIEQVVGQDHARILVNGTGYGAPYSFAVASRAFTTSGLIPGHVDFKNFSYSGFNDTVGGS